MSQQSYVEWMIPGVSAFESFRKAKYSIIARQIRTKLMQALRSDKISAIVADYFIAPEEEHYDLSFLPLAAGPGEIKDDPAVADIAKQPTIIQRGDDYYLYGNGGGWNAEQYAFTQLDGSVVTAALTAARVDVSRRQTLRYDSCLAVLFEEIAVQVAHTHRVSEPYPQYADDPLQIADYKQVINALYFLEVLFIDLEHYGLSAFLSYAQSNNKTRINIDKASQLLNLGVNFAHIFGNDVEDAIQLLSTCYQWVTAQLTNDPSVAGNHTQKPLAYRAGKAIGVGVDQLNPDGQGNLDYDFLTNFSALLPSYINQLTNFINKHSNQTTAGQALSEQKINEMRAEGARLLYEIQNSQSSHSIGVLQALNYVDIATHVYTMSQDILGQTGLLNDASQAWVQQRLRELKSYCQHVFALADKVELEFMLQPGQITHPLRDALSHLYEAWVVCYTRDIANFDEKAESLLKLHDAVFMQQRTHNIQKMIDEAENKRIQVDLAKTALAEFCDIVAAPAYQHLYLFQLPPAVKAQLLQKFYIFKSFMSKVDTNQAQLLQDCLTKCRLVIGAGSVQKAVSASVVSSSSAFKAGVGGTCGYVWATAASVLRGRLFSNLSAPAWQACVGNWSDFAGRLRDMQAWQQYGGQCYTAAGQLSDYCQGPSVVSKILASLRSVEKNAMLHYLELSRATQTLQIELALDKIDRIERDATAVLFPYYQTKNVLQLSDKAALCEAGLEHGCLQFANNVTAEWVANPEALSLKQASALYHYYHNQAEDISKVKSARSTLLARLPDESTLCTLMVERDKKHEVLRTICRQSYSLIQPYLLSYNTSKDAREFDTSLVYVLSEPFTKIPKKLRPIKTQTLFDLLSHEYFVAFLDAHQQTCTEKANVYARKLRELMTQHLLVQEQSPRDGYLLKHTKGSELIKDLRAGLVYLRASLAQPIQDQLMPKERGVPFPALDNITSDFRRLLHVQGEALSAMLVFNFVYTAEQLFLQLEQIGEDTTTLTEKKAISILGCLPHVNNMYSIGSYLCKDPYLREIIEEMLAKVTAIVDQVGPQISPYIMSAEQVEHEPAIPAVNAGTSTEVAKLKPRVPVQYSGIWYTINIITLLPDHLENLLAKQDMCPSEKSLRIERMQQASKRATLQIEKIIRDASASYGKLLLDLPLAYTIYNQLRAKIVKCTDSVHNAVLDNIADINNQIFADILIELDHLEQKFSLQPGLLSEPIAAVLSELYQGMVSALGKSFSEEEQLISDMTAHQRRCDKVLQCYQEQTIEQASTSKFVAQLQALLAALQRRTECPIYNYLAVPDDMQLPAHEFKAKLLAFQRYCCENDFNFPARDFAFEKGRLETVEELHQCRAFLDNCMRFYQTKGKMHQTKLAIATAKFSYLEAFADKQRQKHLEFRQQYAKQYLETKIAQYAARNLGLLHVDKKYAAALREFLLAQQDQLLAEVSAVANIDSALDTNIAARVRTFETQNLREYYKIDAVANAVFEYKKYYYRDRPGAAGDPTKLAFRSAAAVRQDKESFINGCESLWENEEKLYTNVADQFKQIQTMIDEQGRAITVGTVKTSFWGKVLAWFVEVGSFLGLYVPSRQKYYNDINQAAHTEPDMQVLQQKFGLLLADQPSQPQAGDEGLRDDGYLIQEDDQTEEEEDDQTEEDDLDVPEQLVFCALNPGQIAVIQHHYAQHYSRTNTPVLSETAMFLASTGFVLRSYPSEKWRACFSRPQVQGLLQAIPSFSLADTSDAIFDKLMQHQNNVLHPLLLAVDAWEIESGDDSSELSAYLHDQFNTFLAALCLDLNFTVNQRIQLQTGVLSSGETSVQARLAMVRKTALLPCMREINQLNGAHQHDDANARALRAAKGQLAKIDSKLITLHKVAQDTMASKVARLKQEYIEQQFRIRGEKLCARSPADLGMSYLREEYLRLLGIKYQSSSQALCPNVHAQSLSSSFDEEALADLITKTIYAIESEHIKEYYQLEAVITALQNLRSYYVAEQWFDKQDEMDTLLAIAKGASQTPGERMTAIQTTIRNNIQVYENFVQFREENNGQLDYVLKLLSNVQEVLWPGSSNHDWKEQSLERNMRNALTQTPNMVEKVRRFGIFYQHEQPSNPTPPAAAHLSVS